MGNYVTFNMIDQKVSQYVSDYGLDTPSMGFIWLCLETIHNLNSDEIVDCITDGPQDGGIDAVVIMDSHVHIYTTKYTKDFEKTKRNFPETDLDKLVVTMSRVYNKEVGKDHVNEALWEKIEEIWSLQSETIPIFHYYVCSNKEVPFQQAKQKFEKSIDKYLHVNYHYIDQEGLTTRIFDRKFKKVDGTLRFISREYFSRTDGPLKGVVASVAAEDLVNLIRDADYPDKVNENAFNENVRLYRPEHKINTGIKATALSVKNYEFWYLNNGITIVCDECSYTPNTRSPLAKLVNFQIVNGGQTCHALFDASQLDPDRVEYVELLIRVYETKKDDPISEKISETTNTQIPVRTRDLKANDLIQKKLEEGFRALGYFYERKRNQHSGKSREKRLNNELMGQIYMAFYLGMPSEARDNKALVFGDKYDDIFDEDTITAQRMLLPHRIYVPFLQIKKEIQKKKRKKELVDEKESFMSRGIFHMLYAVRIISENQELDLENDVVLTRAAEKAKQLMLELVTKTRSERGDVYTHDKFFKEKGTNRLVREHIESAYEK